MDPGTPCWPEYAVISSENLMVQAKDARNGIWVKFPQSFQGDDYRDRGWKTMVLIGDKINGLRILREEWSPAQAVARTFGSQVRPSGDKRQLLRPTIQGKI